MPIANGEEQERKGIMDVAGLMLVAARTAPKSGGVDDIMTTVVFGTEKEVIAAEIEKMADERGNQRLRRDAENVRYSDLVVLIGVRGTKKFVLDCGACGYSSCQKFEEAAKRRWGLDFEGPTCVFKALDLGIAIGSAVKVASILNVDNRIMYSIGAAVKRLNYMPEASIIMGIPLSAKGKSIYFDRR